MSASFLRGRVEAVVMSHFIEYDTDQLFLLPPSMADWLPKDHVTKFVGDIVNVLDLSKIYEAYEGGEEGRPAFSPRMLVAVWIYAHMVGVRSSRRLERALHENIGFRILSGNQQPDFWTLNRFRTKHRRLLGDLIVQTVRIARNVGLTPMKQAAVDGTRIQANASKHSAMSYSKMVEKEKTLEKEIQEYLDACDEADKRDDKKFGKMRSDELPEHLKESARRLTAIRRAKAELETEAVDRARSEQEQRRAQAEKEGRTFRPRTNPDDAKPDPKAQRNFTDPESRIMSKKGKEVIQGYNAQAAVDADTQIILAADLTNTVADSPHLLPMLEQVQSNTGTSPEELTADAGYFSVNNILETEKRMPHTNVLIPPDRQKHGESKKSIGSAPPPPEEAASTSSTDSSETESPSQDSSSGPPTESSWTQLSSADDDDASPPTSSTENQAPAPDDATHTPPTDSNGTQVSPHNSPAASQINDDAQRSSVVTPAHSNSVYEMLAARMRQKLNREHGRERYKKRRCSVEPVFGQIKGGRGLRQFLHRGTEKVRDMWRFECAVHNLVKIFTAGMNFVPT
jgi:transposase